MSAESDGLFRLLEEISGRLTAIRHDERKATKAVEALLALFRAYQRAACTTVVHHSEVETTTLLAGPSPPSPEQIREFLQSLEWPTVWPERDDHNVAAVREWLERLAGEGLGKVLSAG